MSDTNGNGNGRQIGWLMGVVGTLLTAGAIGWASGISAAAEKAMTTAQEAKTAVAEARADNALVLHRLGVLEAEQKEQRKVLDKIWGRVQGER